MTFDRLEHSGNAVAATLAGSITSGDTTLSLVDATNWPLGATGPFYFEIDAGTGNYEKILATSRSGNVLSGLIRGVDGTVATSHAPVTGAVLHIFTAVEADEANRVVNQTLGQITAIGDVLVGSAAHTLRVETVGANNRVLIADSSTATGRAWRQVNTNELTDSAVATAKIADSAVTTAKIADGALTTAKVLDSAVATAKIADSAVTAAKIASNAVTTAKVLDAAITTAKVDSTLLALIQRIDPQAVQATVTGGPTSGTTELTIATLTIAAQSAAYFLECAAFWSGTADTDFDMYDFRVKVDGTQVGKHSIRQSGNNARLGFSIPTTTIQTIAASTGCTVTVTLQRVLGTGTITTATAGLVTAHMRYTT